MADDVNALGTNDPAGTDPNNVPGDLQELKDKINAGSIVRRLTQAQIDALPAAQKPIGVLVHNSTAGRLQRWNGAKWVTLLDSATDPIISRDFATLVLNGTNGWATTFFQDDGEARFGITLRPDGSFSIDRYVSDSYNSTPIKVTAGGDITFSDAPTHPNAVADGESATLGQVTAAVNTALPKAGGVLTGPLILGSDNGWRVLGSAGGVFAVQRRDPATGAYVDNPLLITASGHVESRSHIAGTHSGTTNPAGYLNMPITASPTGTWIVVANAQVTATGAPIACTAVQTAATTITFTVPNASTAIQLSWHAIAV